MLKILTTLVCLLILLFNYQKRQLISSSTMWIFGYLLIMVFYPIYETEIDYFHEGLIDILAFFGVICFFAGLLFSSKYTIKRKSKDNAVKYAIAPDFNVSRIAFLITFILSLAALIYLLGTEGVRSILIGTTTSKQFALSSDRSNSLYVFAVHLMVPCVLGMWVSAKSKKERILSFFALLIYVIETVLFGFTRIFLITIIAIVLIFEIRNKPQRTQFRYAIIGILLVMAALVSMNFIRSLGLGQINNIWSYINLDYIFQSTDFSASYYWFDKLLYIDPPYINPIVYLKPIFMIIPRSIWETKPDPLSLQILRIVDPVRASTGYSTAGNSVLGEGYAILGYFGMFLFPFIWGLVCGSLDKNYYRRLRAGINTSLSNIYYYIFAVFIVISGQRGDWCQYMGIVCWFYFLPLYLMSKVTLRKREWGRYHDQ